MSDNTDVEWYNWFTGEPNNWLATDEECAIGNVEANWLWHDIRCDARATVLCQADKTLPTAPGISSTQEYFLVFDTCEFKYPF